MSAQETPGSEPLPLYCEDCNEVHMLTFIEVERIVYCLQGASIDARIEPDEHPDPTAEAYCLLTVLRWSHDGEMYEEYASASVESREHHQPLDCPGHNDEMGPHHVPLCHYFDDEVEAPADGDHGGDG